LDGQFSERAVKEACGIKWAPPSIAALSNARRFAVGLAFPAEHRQSVAQVAESLAATFGEDRVLYDRFHQAEFARPDLDTHLAELYRTESDLVVIFLAPEYATGTWAGLQWRHVRQLLATIERERIMLVALGDPGDLAPLGTLGTIGYIDARHLSSDDLAEAIVARYRANRESQRETFVADVSRVDQYAPGTLVGRDPEIAFLSGVWNKAMRGESPRLHVVVIVGVGGAGKTALVSAWTVDFAAQDWPSCDAAFAWSFYGQGSHEQGASSAIARRPQLQRPDSKKDAAWPGSSGIVAHCSSSMVWTHCSIHRIRHNRASSRTSVSRAFSEALPRSIEACA
jgi:hypothetical protein